MDFGEIKFALSNFLSNEVYDSWNVQLTFDALINALRFKVLTKIEGIQAIILISINDEISYLASMCIHGEDTS